MKEGKLTIVPIYYFKVVLRKGDWSCSRGVAAWTYFEVRRRYCVVGWEMRPLEQYEIQYSILFLFVQRMNGELRSLACCVKFL